MDYEIDVEKLPAGAVPEEGETIELVRRSSKKEPLPPYNIVGNGFTNRNGTSVDILGICLQLNQAENKLLQFFRDRFTMRIIRHKEQPNIITPTDYDEFTKYLAIALKKNYTHLEYLQVIRRVKRGTYVLNPLMYLPPKGYSEMYVAWNAAGVKEEV